MVLRGSRPGSEVGIFVAFAHRRTSDGSSVTEIPSSLELVHVGAAMNDIKRGQVRPPFVEPNVVDPNRNDPWQLQAPASHPPQVFSATPRAW